MRRFLVLSNFAINVSKIISISKYDNAYYLYLENHKRASGFMVGWIGSLYEIDEPKVVSKDTHFADYEKVEKWIDEISQDDTDKHQ